MMQRSFSNLECTAKKRVTRRDRFLGVIEAVTTWSELITAFEPFYPKDEGRGRPPMGLKREQGMYIVNGRRPERNSALVAVPLEFVGFCIADTRQKLICSVFP